MTSVLKIKLYFTFHYISKLFLLVIYDYHELYFLCKNQVTEVEVFIHVGNYKVTIH